MKARDRLEQLVFRCRACGAWRLPDQYMRKPHRCVAEEEQETT
ncbi:hypothetical protein HYQ03_gp41 [Arthrobacter phage Kuleana]|uniref:Uncharacterized protein n=1 Tax=Arthrobacter phage Kuleana TaxID=2653270 RepID=A0A5Q2WEN1_9CAUD|nr:hypothetical protein HYQ03_gp41 [Arthrobacter phage Kuleana]QGH74528.1 hypothetical protein SEA_KULEANA_41 [Arthrobacter phage Kuleana]